MGYETEEKKGNLESVLVLNKKGSAEALFKLRTPANKDLENCHFAAISALTGWGEANP